MNNQRTGGLRHSFNDQNPGHHGIVGKVAGEMRLVEANGLVSDRTFKQDDFFEALDKKKRSAMRQQPLDLLYIENQPELPALTHCCPVSTSSRDSPM